MFEEGQSISSLVIGVKASMDQTRAPKALDLAVSKWRFQWEMGVPNCRMRADLNNLVDMEANMANFQKKMGAFFLKDFFSEFTTRKFRFVNSEFLPKKIGTHFFFPKVRHVGSQVHQKKSNFGPHPEWRKNIRFLAWF